MTDWKYSRRRFSVGSKRSISSNRSSPLLRSPPRRGGGRRRGLERSAAVERLERFERKSSMKLYNVSYSGNSYKVRLLLAQLGIPYEISEVDILKDESHTAEFLKINPNGRTPVLD